MYFQKLLPSSNPNENSRIIISLLTKYTNFYLLYLLIYHETHAYIHVFIISPFILNYNKLLVWLITFLKIPLPHLLD